MKFRNVLNSGYIGWVVVIAALIFWYFFYFFSYVPGQESRLRERGFRILGEFSKNMTEKHKYYSDHFINYGPYYHLREFFNDNSDFEETIIIESNLKSKDIPEDSNTEIINNAINVAKALNPNINRQDGKEDEHFRKKGYKNSNEPSFYYSYDEHDEVFIVPLSTFMEGLKFDRLFENIVVFDSTEVLYNTTEKMVHDITNPGILLDTITGAQGGFTRIIVVRGEKKRALILPVDIVQKRFYLAGIIPEQQFKKKTRSINFQVMIFVSGLLLVLLVGMPVLKIVLTDPHDHMNATDTHRTAVSLMISAGILTLISIGAFHHKIADRQYQKKRLENISEKIYSNVNKDLEMIIHFSRQVTGEDSSFNFRLSKFVHDNLRAKRFSKIDKDSLLPFPINEIIFINDSGIIKNAVSRTELAVDKTTLKFRNETLRFKLPDLNQRLYFQNAKDITKSWYNKKFSKYLYIQSIMSYNTGGKEAAISFHLDNLYDYEPKVLAITTEFPTFYKQILPEDAEFAIINSSGDVLFHSLPSKNLHENFFDECGLNSDLAGAVDLRIAKNTYVNYNENRWMTRITPIKDTPLILITLLDIQQMQKRNTRIVLFTFYFFAVTFLCIIIGMLVIRFSRPKNSYIQSKSWLLNWLIFQPGNYMRYKLLLFVLLIITICQGFGSLFIEKPVTMLVYQIMFIVLSGFLSLVILGKRKLQLHKFYKKANIPITFIVLILILLAVLLLRLQFTPILILPFIVIVLTVLYVLISVKKKWLENPGNNDVLMNYPLIPYRIGEFKHHVKGNFKPKGNHIRDIYNLGIYIWLLCLSFIPVIHYYRTIEKQEEFIRDRGQMIHIARENLLLEEQYQKDTASWVKRIRGNGIDGLKVSYHNNAQTNGNSTAVVVNGPDLNDQIYNLLSDPITEGDKQMSYLKNQSYFSEWNIDALRLTYSAPGKIGSISVIKSEFINRSELIWLLFGFPAIIILLFIWLITVYVNKYLLYTNQHKWKNHDPIHLNDIIFDNKYPWVLISTFDESRLKSQAIRLVKDYNDNKSGQAKPKRQLYILSVNDLLNQHFDIDRVFKGEHKTIWMSDIESCLPQINNHDKFLSQLQLLNQKAEGKIIILIPFEPEFISEYLEDYIKENKIEDQDKNHIFSLKRTWENCLYGYHRYYIPELQSDIKTDEIEEHTGRKLFYNHIWNNLCQNEKLVLYDLAADGLINLKNKKMITRLMNKGLIVPGQYLGIFSKGFEYFINNSLKPKEKRVLEKSASFRGMWHSLRFPITIVLIIVAAFVFISQGYSIEKVTAIFAGVFTLMATMVRLFQRSG